MRGVVDEGDVRAGHVEIWAPDRFMEEIVAETVAQLGKLDILVANAASGVHKPVLELSEQDFRSTLDVTLLGARLAVAPYPGASLHAAIASVTNGVVDWTDTSCGAATAIAAPEKLATSLIEGVANSVIIVQTTYGYSSPVAYLLPASIALTHTAFARPRYGPSVLKN